MAAKLVQIFAGFIGLLFVIRLISPLETNVKYSEIYNVLTLTSFACCLAAYFWHDIQKRKGKVKPTSSKWLIRSTLLFVATATIATLLRWYVFDYHLPVYVVSLLVGIIGIWLFSIAAYVFKRNSSE